MINIFRINIYQFYNFIMPVHTEFGSDKGYLIHLINSEFMAYVRYLDMTQGLDLINNIFMETFVSLLIKVQLVQ